MHLFNMRLKEGIKKQNIDVLCYLDTILHAIRAKLLYNLFHLDHFRNAHWIYQI